MNRNLYFDYIEEKLAVLSQRILTKGKLNLLDIHGHSENFYLNFFNLLFNYKLINLNEQIYNVESIDLIDNENRIIIQVSATSTKGKVESALEKSILMSYSGYSFHFISISRDASNLRKMSFKNPFSISFNPITDIHDISTILKDIAPRPVEEIKKIYLFIKDELGSDTDIVKLDSNLATIIGILAKEEWIDEGTPPNINSFEIERKIAFNEIDKAKEIIHEYCIYNPRVNAKYAEFDTRGVNKSKSVLATIRKEYLKVKGKKADDVFYSVTDEVKKIVINSANFNRIPIDELDLCVDILVVDAFIRCKVFENPIGYSYVATR
jgi:hypothetical protein